MNNVIERKDIHSGYMVVFRNGDTGLVQRVGDRFTRIVVTEKGWNYLSEWDDTLCAKEYQDYARDHDIMEVYGLVRETSSYGSCMSLSSASDRKLLWERKEAKKMTMQEICEALGYEVEIVK